MKYLSKLAIGEGSSEGCLVDDSAAGGRDVQGADWDDGAKLSHVHFFNAVILLGSGHGGGHQGAQNQDTSGHDVELFYLLGNQVGDLM